MIPVIITLICGRLAQAQIHYRDVLGEERWYQLEIPWRNHRRCILGLLVLRYLSGDFDGVADFAERVGLEATLAADRFFAEVHETKKFRFQHSVSLAAPIEQFIASALQEF